MHSYHFKYILFLLLLVGCTHTVSHTKQTEINQLTTLFKSLDKSITYEEATQLSQDIFRETKRLSKEFKLTSPPYWHNFLVNVGLREKGLCYHWSDALYAFVLERDYPSFEFHLMGANIGEYWSEHNVLMVIGKDKRMQEDIIQEGIIIDPWRDSGKLYFSKVKDDTDYVWKHRMHRACQR